MMLATTHEINNTHIGVDSGRIKDNNIPGIIEYDLIDSMYGLKSKSVFSLFLFFK